jgi:hypothetical protein
MSKINLSVKEINEKRTELFGNNYNKPDKHCNSCSMCILRSCKWQCAYIIEKSKAIPKLNRLKKLKSKKIKDLAQIKELEAKIKPACCNEHKLKELNP